MPAKLSDRAAQSLGFGPNKVPSQGNGGLPQHSATWVSHQVKTSMQYPPLQVLTDLLNRGGVAAEEMERVSRGDWSAAD